MHLSKKNVLLIVGAILVLSLAYLLYMTINPLANPKYYFQYYSPTRLPVGFHITAKRIDVSGSDGQTYGVSVDLNFRTEDWVYGISESKANSDSSPDSSTTATTLNNYSPSSVGVTCRQVSSPKGQSYRLCHWIDYGRISVYEINFIKSGTYIGTQFPGTLQHVVPVSEISDYVDSFEKSIALEFPIVSGL